MTNKPQFVGERETVKLSEIAKIKAGNVAPKKDAFTEDGIPFVRAGSLTNLLAGGSLADLEKIDGGTAQKLRLTLFPAGTVVFAKSGMSCMTGNVYVLPKPCYVVSHLACVIPNGNYASYLKHYFRFNRPNRLIENPSFPSIKLSKIRGIKLKLPSPEKGVRQVQPLERIESQIGQAKALLRYLDSLVKSRFVEMFGDPTNNEFNFPVEKLGGLGLLERGKSKHRPRNAPELRGGPNGPYPLIQTGDIANAGTYLATYEDTYTELGLLQSRIWPKGTLCITIAANIAKTSILAIDACFPDSVAGFTTNGKVTNLFMHYWFSFFQGILEKQAPQAAQKNINLRILQNLDVIAPPLALQQEFADFVAQVDKSRFVAQQQIEKLQMLYDSLAQEYFGD